MVWHRVVIAATLALGGLLAQPALAWQQAHAKSGCGERWLTEPIEIKVQQHDGAVHGILNPDYLSAVAAAAAHWQGVTCDLCPASAPNLPPLVCAQHALGVMWTDKQFVDAPDAGLGPGCTGYDATTKACKGWMPNGNFVIAVHEHWPFGANVVSITVVTANTATGEIVDADIGLDDSKTELGNPLQSFCYDTCEPGQIDLCSALTHEFGHLLGMDHSDVTEATMYAAASAGEKTKCSLAADDVAGICTMYASTCDPSAAVKAADAGGDTAGAAKPGGSGGGNTTCSAGRTGSGAAWLVLVAAGWALRRRRT